MTRQRCFIKYRGRQRRQRCRVSAGGFHKLSCKPSAQLTGAAISSCQLASSARKAKVKQSTLELTQVPSGITDENSQN